MSVNLIYLTFLKWTPSCLHRSNHPTCHTNLEAVLHHMNFGNVSNTFSSNCGRVKAEDNAGFIQSPLNHQHTLQFLKDNQPQNSFFSNNHKTFILLKQSLKLSFKHLHLHPAITIQDLNSSRKHVRGRIVYR